MTAMDLPLHLAFLISRSPTALKKQVNLFILNPPDNTNIMTLCAEKDV